MNLVFKYTIFCIFAITLNLLAQRIVLNLYEVKTAYVLALFIGTIVGLIVKYFLDKNFIFNDYDTSFNNNSKKFSMYTFNGIITTMIFWGTESLFFFIYETSFAREFGAIIGLSVGYFIKYRLDKKFVFQKNNDRA